MTENLHMVVLGAGSIGCYLGGLLANAGAKVTLIGRSRYQGEIAENGLTLTHFSRAPLHIPQVDFQTDYDNLKTADVILLCTKSQDTAEAGQAILKYAKPDVQVVSFQNGIRNVETLQSVLPDAQLIPAIVPFNVTPSGPGAFHSGTEGALIVGDGANAELVAAFKRVGQAIKVDPDILAAQWAKMIVNLNNALNALSGGTLVEGLMQRDYRRALGILVEEALSVAKASGVTPSTFNGRKPAQLLKTLRLPNFLYRLVMQLIVKIDVKARSSMLDDLEIGRVSEIDYLQGEIVKRAELAGMEAPYNARILALTNAAFKQKKSPRLSGADILKALKE